MSEGVIRREQISKYCLISLVYLETSASTGQNVERAVEILLDRVMRRIDTSVDRSILPHQKLLRCHESPEAATSPKKKSCFC